MAISRSVLPALSMSDALQHLHIQDNQSQMKTFIEQNGLKLDRLRRLGDYCATLIYERDPNMIINEHTEIIDEKKKSRTSKKKNIT
jgi:HJR/Mrr/RecB family endonuclease